MPIVGELLKHLLALAELRVHYGIDEYLQILALFLLTLVRLLDAL